MNVGQSSGHGFDTGEIGDIESCLLQSLAVAELSESSIISDEAPSSPLCCVVRISSAGRGTRPPDVDIPVTA